MPLSIKEPLVLAQEHVKVFRSLTIQREATGMTAQLVFELQTPKGAFLQEEMTTFRGKEFNSFWKSFKSGKFLYAQSLGVSEASLPDELETEFFN